MTTQTVTYYKCDRCKKRFRRKGDVRRLSFSQWRDWPGEGYGVIVEDLCDECQRSFLEWMKGDD